MSAESTYLYPVLPTTNQTQNKFFSSDIPEIFFFNEIVLWGTISQNKFTKLKTLIILLAIKR